MNSLKKCSALVFCVGSFACGGSPTASTESAAREEPIIGGVEAQSPRYDATGALVVVSPTTGAIRMFCSATLIGKSTVVTANHCTSIVRIVESRGVRAQFALGPDAKNPKRLVPVVGFESAPPGQHGGLLGQGRDVAVMHLDSPVSDVPLPVLRQADERDIGRSFTMVGYGVRNDLQEDGQRMRGRATLRALEGRWYELLFGDFDTFFDFFQTDAVVGEEPTLELAQAWWSQYSLEPGYEALLGRLPGEAVNCYGDSGGPVLAERGNTMFLYGVINGTEYSVANVCDYGSFAAVFGPDTMNFLRKARTWQDPCGCVTERGQCRGHTAVRCSGIGEGERRLVVTRCEETSQVCIDDGTRVGCGTAP